MTVTQWHVFSLRWIETIGKNPWKLAFGLQLFELSGTEVEVMVPDTCNVGSNVVQDWDHVATSGDRTFGARVVRVSREDCDEFYLILELLIIAVVVAKSLESSRATCWF
jgi:hypothetical protein